MLPSPTDGSFKPTGFSPTMDLFAEDPEVTMSLASLESSRTLLVIGEPNSPLDTNPELSRSASSEHSLVESAMPSPAGPRFPVRPSLLSEALDLMRSLAITEVSPPNYAQPELGAESGEFCVPPTTHLVATVEDLTDMLDYASEDIDGMDDDAGDKPSQDPPFTGRWTATSTYDVYMVDTPKNDEDDGR